MNEKEKKIKPIIDDLEFFLTSEEISKKLSRFTKDIASIAQKESKISFFSTKGVVSLVKLLPVVLGNPKKILNLYNAYKSGLFDDPDFQKKLAQSNIKDKVVDFAEKNANSIASLTQVLGKIEANLVENALIAFGTSEGKKLIEKISEEMNSEEPDYMSIAKNALSFIGQNQKLQEELSKSVWLRSALKEALESKGDKDNPSVGDIMRQFGVSKELLDLFPTVLRESDKAANIVSMIRNGEPLLLWVEESLKMLNGNKELQDAIINNPKMISTLVVAIVSEVPRINSVAKEFNFDPSILEVLKIVLKEPKETERLIASINTRDIPKLLNTVHKLLIESGDVSAELQLFAQGKQKKLIPFIGQMVAIADPITIAPIAVALNEDEAQKNLLEKFSNACIAKFGDDKKEEIERCMKDNSSTIASMISRAALGLEKETFALNLGMLRNDEKYKKFDEKFCPAMGINDYSMNSMEIMQGILEENSEIRKAGLEFNKNFEKEITEIAEIGIRPILDDPSKVFNLLKISKNIGISNIKDLAQELHSIFNAEQNSLFEEKREQLIRVGEQFNPAGRKGLGTVIDTIAGKSFLSGKVFSKPNELHSEKVFSKPNELHSEREFSQEIKTLAENLGDRIAFNLFGIGKDNNRKEDNGLIKKHMEKVIDKFTHDFPDSDLKSVLSKKEVINYLTSSYEEKSKYTTVGLFTGGIYMPEENLTMSFAEKMAKNIGKHINGINCIREQKSNQVQRSF